MGEILMVEDIEINNKLETINEKLDNVTDTIDSETVEINGKLIAIDTKLDTIIGMLNNHSVTLNNILSVVNRVDTPSESPEEDSEVTSQFKTDLQSKIDEGLPYTQVKDWIIETLTELGIYSEDSINIKLFNDIKGNIIFEVKTRPYLHMGKLIQFLRDSMGESDKFETSRYTMNLIMWWELTKNQQMEDQYSTTDITNQVTNDWGDNDSIDFGN